MNAPIASGTRVCVYFGQRYGPSALVIGVAGNMATVRFRDGLTCSACVYDLEVIS